MHVLLAVHQFFPDFCYGTEQYTLSLARGLRELGHRVTLVTGHAHPGESWGSSFTAYRHDGFLVLSLRGCFTRRASFADSYWREDLEPVYEDLFWELRPDVVHASHLIHLTPSFLSAAARTGLPLVLTLTDFWGLCWTGQLTTSRLRRPCSGPAPDGSNCIADFFDAREAPTRSPVLNAALRVLRATPLEDRAFAALRALPRALRDRVAPDYEALRQRIARMRARYALADRWIAPSQHLLDAYVQNGFARERFHRIPYGVAPPAPEEERQLAARFADRPPGRPLRFGYMGQIAAHKGVLELVRAFRAASLPNATLAIHGDPERVPAYGRAVREAAAGDPRIALHGPYPSERFYAVLSGIDVLAVPSVWHENAPFVLLGALAAGTPVVVPGARGMLEFLDPEAAFVYPLGDGDGLRDALERAAGARDAVFARSPAARAYRFAPLDCARETLAVYEEVLKQRRPVRFEPGEDRLEFELVDADAQGDDGPAALLETLAVLGPEGFEVRCPEQSVATRAAHRTRRTLALRGHAHAYVSLWSREERALELGRHPGFAAASRVEIVARANQGGPTLLRYAYALPDGRRSEGELRLAFEKPHWTRLAVSLRTARGHHRLERLAWVPASWNARPPLKLDLRAIRFPEPGRSATG